MFSKVTKRPFSMMEVMITIVLILFCLIPLIYPNLALYRDQNQFTEKIKIDHAVTLLYGELLERLHRREIHFEQLIQKNATEMTIPSESLQNAGIGEKFPYTFSQTVQQVKMKGETKGNYIAAIVEFTYSVQKKDSKDSPLVFTYNTIVVKLKPESEREQKEETPKKPPAKPSKPSNPPTPLQEGT